MKCPPHPPLSPAFAEAASRRQALGEKDRALITELEMLTIAMTELKHGEKVVMISSSKFSDV